MKILLVDDDKFFQQFYSSKLKEEGYEVLVANDGEDALLKIPQFQPNLVLLDLIMPKKDGFEVLSALSTQSLQMPVIVFSTLGNQPDVEKAMKLGAKDFINKSFYDFDNLKTKIHTLLGQ